jgi:spore coat protein A, manganese oxidase
MNITRRKFLKAAGVLGVGTALPMGLARRAYPFVQSPANLRKFVIALPGLGPTAKNEIGQYIPVAAPNKTKYPGTDFYRIIMGQYEQLMHPDLPGTTKLWGYADATDLLRPRPHLPDFKYLGGVIVANMGRPVRIDFTNLLPPFHPLPVDHSIPGAETGQFQNRTAVHLHGGLVPWTSDGGPFAWTTPFNLVHGPDWQPGDFYYPNNSSARFQWYHDHAYGITRLNAYAGLATAYLITDSAEASYVGPTMPIPDVQIPLIIQDKSFVPQNISAVDPKWKWGTPGDLWYPHEYEVNTFANGPSNAKGRWDWGPTVLPQAKGTLPLPAVSAVPEAFLDTTVINGACYPYLNVQPRRYRFRILNGSQARFYNLQLYVDNGKGDASNIPGPAMIQIGTEGGFLPRPVVLTSTPMDFDPLTGNPSAYTLLLGPAERADIIVDFRGFEGQKLILYSDTPAPFPSGDPRNDYYTGNADQTAFGGAPSTLEGFGPNTRSLMQIRVGTGPRITGEPSFDDTWNMLKVAIPDAFNKTQPPLLTDKIGEKVQGLGKTLTEDFDKYGRLVQRLGTTTQNGLNNQGLPTWGRDLKDVPTETANNGEVQVWNIFNMTGDTHPIHFHLVNVQIISRAPFDATTPDFTAIGSPTPPDLNEMGWKETVRMNPGEVTTVIMKFDAPAPPAWIKKKTSPRTGGYEYVWHCHILEHEEHDMMRPLIVNP